ncbi:MAG: hypothetical protein ACREYF_04045 [Gammaproteobacteria bacterium]
MKNKASPKRAAMQSDIRFVTLLVLPLTLACASFSTVAQESGVEGFGDANDDFCNSTSSWTVLQQAAVTIPAGSIYHCVVNGSATAANPGDEDSDAGCIFALSTNPLNINSPPTGSQRVHEFPQLNPDLDDADANEVSSTYTFRDISGTRTFYWLARKHQADDPAMRIDGSSISVACSDFLL